MFILCMMFVIFKENIPWWFIFVIMLAALYDLSFFSELRRISDRTDRTKRR